MSEIMNEQEAKRMNEAAVHYATNTVVSIPNADEVSVEAIMHNIRAVAFAAGYREGFQAATRGRSVSAVIAAALM